MTKPRLLDLFCGAGGAAMGYSRAGFEVVGVDINPQPNYPFEFHQGDAMTWPLDGFDAIHASPPCQAYVRSGMVAKDGRHPDLLPLVREALQATGLPYIIENVPGAPMRVDIMLCGSMFGLDVRRHRWFEFAAPTIALVSPCDHSKPITGVYGHPHGKGGAWRNGKRPMLPSDLPTWSSAMGIDWMTAREIALSIPPAYTEFIGAQLLDAIAAPLHAHLKAAHMANLWRLAPDADHAAITAHHDADHALWRRQTGGVGHTHERDEWSPLEQRKANK